MISSSPRRAGWHWCGAIMLIVVSGITASAQTLKTPHGHPDLQGMWLNDTATPLERLKDWAEKATLTDAEAQEYEKRYQLDRTAALTRDTPEFELDVAGDLDTYVPGRLLPGNRTSIITDPKDGRVPALTPEAQRRLKETAERQNSHYAEGPENFTFPERCLQVANTSSPPMMPAFYNNNIQIVQTRDYVLLVSEMIHDVRIIPLDGRPHLPVGMGMWKGHSIGHWDRDTLVIDTTNFTDKTTFRGSGPGLHVVERFSLTNANTLNYQFTVEDPASFATSWTGESQMTRTDDRMFEFACHEANHSMTNTLRGARFMEKEKTTEKTP
jgi:hypothetical protein